MEKAKNLTVGKIMPALVKFSLPVLLSLFLQALYGGVDLLVVGRFATTADVSGVATGSQIMHTITCVVTGLSMGITVFVGELIGKGDGEKAGRAIGTGICLFGVLAVALTAFVVLGANMLSKLMNAPAEAFENTVAYLMICGGGMIFIVAYNLLGSIFRGLGDSNTPLITVAIACVINVVGDLLFVAVFHWGAAGAAAATVIAQGVSVLVSLLIIVKKRKSLPFTFSKKYVRFDKEVVLTELKLGTPIALQDLLVGISFLIILAIVNKIDVVSSAGVGIAEKVTAFIMLIPSSFMQSMSAFVAQNIGAKKPERATKALKYGIITSFITGIAVGIVTFFLGNKLSAIFSGDAGVIAASHSYLKSYAIDCCLTPFLFCFIGYFNGREKTMFVMSQGLVGAFCVRVPLSLLFSKMAGATLFSIGLATPCSTVIQIVMCLTAFAILNKKDKGALRKNE